MFQVNINNLMRDTAKISEFERISGSPQELASFEYLKKQLQQLGAITKLQLHDAFVSLPIAAELTVNGLSLPCQTHSMSAAVKNLEAPLCFVGAVANLQPANCQGNIVVINGRAERDPIIKAAALGAVAVICISGEYIYESCISPVWGSPSHLNKHLLPQIPAVSITVATAAKLEQLFTAEHPQPLAKLSTHVESKWHKQPLLTAQINAPLATDKFVMFSAHVDSWYYGAMDNAAANATLLEVARIATLNKSTLMHNLRLVFFSGHSQGRYSGSSWYFDNNWEDIAYNCLISVNIDSPGAIGANDLTRSTIMPEARPFAQKLLKELVNVDFVGRRYSRFADQSFWGTGVSCAFASFSKQQLNNTGSVGPFSIPVGGSLDLGWWWHTPADTFDKIDPHNLKRDASIFANFIMHYLQSRVLDLDFRESIREIHSALLDLQQKAGSHFSFALPLQRSALISDKLEQFYSKKPSENSTPQLIQAYNRKLHIIGRNLVRLNYTKGHYYHNDPAIAQPPIPALSDIALLQNADDNTRKEIITELTRSLNFIMHCLLKTLNVLSEEESL